MRANYVQTGPDGHNSPPFPNQARLMQRQLFIDLPTDLMYSWKSLLLKSGGSDGPR